MTTNPGPWAPPRPDAAIVPAAPFAPRRRIGFWRAPFTADTWKRTSYAFVHLFLGAVWFGLMVTGLSLSAALAITLVGFPLLMVTFAVARGLTRFERAFARVALGTKAGEPLRKQPTGSSPWRRFAARVSDPWSWREVAYLLLCLPMGIAMFTVTIVVWSMVLWGISFPIFGWALTRNDRMVWLGGFHPDFWFAIVVYFLIAVVVFFIGPWFIKGVTSLHGALVDGVLGTSRAELEAQALKADVQRTRSVDSAAAERRRIERDLHDGAQARLVSLAMDLGRAREKLAAGGEGRDEAAAIVAEAHEEAKRALVELRDLARGIHPAILTDRGLDAALSSLAARSPVPVNVNVDVAHRPSPAVEAIAYFVVAEGLTNIARHSQAARADVTVSRRGDRLVVSIHDDGVGGADTDGGGTGLAGLAERVESVDGYFRVISPPGGPTTVLADLPCT
jgi:signal transduction histidine kinase